MELLPHLSFYCISSISICFSLLPLSLLHAFFWPSQLLYGQYLSCMLYFAISIGTAFVLCYPIINCSFMRLYFDKLGWFWEVCFQIDPVSAGAQYEKEFIVCSLDLLSGLVEGLGPGIESLVLPFSMSYIKNTASFRQLCIRALVVVSYGRFISLSDCPVLIFWWMAMLQMMLFYKVCFEELCK